MMTDDERLAAWQKRCDEAEEQVRCLKIRLVESQRIRAIKQRRIIELENTLGVLRQGNAYTKKGVFTDGKILFPIEEEAKP